MQFTLEDFRQQMTGLNRLGPLQKITALIPGMSGMMKHLKGVDAERAMRRMLGIVDAMTADEKRHPAVALEQNRSCRIAVGAGVQPHEVEDLVQQFHAMLQVMTAMAGKPGRPQTVTLGESHNSSRRF